MILDMHRQALVVGIETRPFGYRPAQQHAVQFQSEVIMQVAGGVLLDSEGKLCSLALADAALGLGGILEIALGVVLLEGHSNFLSWVGVAAEALPGYRPPRAFVPNAALRTLCRTIPTR